MLSSDHPERAHCSRQGVQAQADPETTPETRPRMPGPGRAQQGAGDGGGRKSRPRQSRCSQLICARIMNEGDLLQRVHQVEIKRRLEEFTRRERVQKIKVGHLHLNTALLPYLVYQ